MDMIERLKALKRQQGLSYAKLSQLTGAPEQNLIRWMTGKHQMSFAWQALIEARLSE